MGAGVVTMTLVRRHALGPVQKETLKMGTISSDSSPSASQLSNQTRYGMPRKIDIVPEPCVQTRT